jgi:SAM-dependent methyltransferase
MDQHVIDILRCPMSGGRLRLDGGVLVSASGKYRYGIIDGIVNFLSPLDEGASLRDEKAAIQQYYDTFGWQTVGASYKEVQTFTDQRESSWSYTARCIARVRKFLPRRGRYLLDAASGPIPYPEYMRFHEHFERRLCLDLSIEALREAKRKLGDRGVYLLADLTRLPLQDHVIDAAVSFHTIYHIPADEQERAFTELHRVLKPGGRAAIIYSWGYSPLNACLSRLLNLLGAPPVPKTAGAGLYYHAHSRQWFFGKRWPFRYDVRGWRTLGSLQRLRSSIIVRIALCLLFVAESLFPRFFGRYGQYPLIVVTKESRGQVP